MVQDSLKISIPKELKQKFKAYAAFADRDMSDIAVELIKQWVQTQENNTDIQKMFNRE